jgi:hypothetical protein
MTGSTLSPAGALAWVESLSVDLRGAAVLDGGGALLAGDAEVGRRAAAALAARPDDDEVRDGDILVVRGARHAVVAALGPGSLVRVARLDLAAAADGLDGT